MCCNYVKDLRICLHNQWFRRNPGWELYICAHKMNTLQPQFPPTDLLPALQHEWDVLQESDRLVPDAYRLQVQRVRKLPHWHFEDAGKVVYTPNSKKETGTLELTFCISGNIYCRAKQTSCDNCALQGQDYCGEKIECIDVVSCTFSEKYLSAFLQQPAPALKSNHTFSEEVMAFSHPHAFVRTLPVCGKSRMTIESLLQTPYKGTLEQLYLNAQLQMLLLNSLECMIGEKEEPVFTCKFLSNEADREKIARARDLLLEHIGNPITIKTLSRKVAMNECYLKKGFKEIYGSTIFEFYQSQRMDHAKYLLYEKGLSVTEVSLLLGYSSISHFSTAFKKHTGLKPCELLLRS